MTGFLADTNVISETAYPSPNAKVLQWLDRAPANLLFVSVMTIGELQLGIEKLPIGRRRTQLERWLEDEAQPWFGSNKLPVTEAIAYRWARLIYEARKQGRTLQTSDALIGATALEHGITLVTRNTKDFTGLGIALLNPWD